MKIALLTAILFLLTTHTVWCEPLYLVSDETLAPYSYYENGEATGIDVDIIKEAARRSGIEVKIDLFPWKRTLMMLKTGKADGAFSLFRNNEREELFHFSNNPVHISELAAFMAKDSIAIYKSISDLYGEQVIIVAGFSISDDFDKAVRENKIKPSYVSGADGGLKRLLNSTDGCFISNLVSVLYFAKQLKVADRIEVIPPLVNVKRAAYLCSLKDGVDTPGKNEKFAKLDRAIGGMINDGTIKRVTNRYIK